MLQTEMIFPRLHIRSSSTNWARRTVTSLIRATPLSISQTAMEHACRPQLKAQPLNNYVPVISIANTLTV